MNAAAYQTRAIQVGRGLNLADAAGFLAPGEARVLRNFYPAGLGRLESRLAHGRVEDANGPVAGIFRFPFYSGATPIGALGVQINVSNEIVLVRMDTTGQFFGSGMVIGSSTARPVLSAAVLGQKLWLCGFADGENLPLVYFDAATDTVVSPTFIFDEDAESPAAAAILARVCCQYANHLFVAGYDTENNPNYPGMLRFTYLGLAPDTEGSGDAGEASGSPGLFDLEDKIPVGERGAPIIAMGAVSGRLLTLSDQAVHHLFGSDRFSWNVELVDGDGGTVGTDAFVTAGSRAYWWNGRRGPLQYTGGESRELRRKVERRFPEIDVSTIVAAHVAEKHQIRFHYGNDVSSFLAWDYQEEEWTEGLLPFRVFCAGSISRRSQNVETGVETSPDGPLAAPTSFSSSVTSTTALIGWTTGDSSAHTEVYLGNVLKATVDPGVNSYLAGGLSSSTPYAAKVRHVKNGQASNFLTGSFETDDGPGVGGSAPADPVDLLARQIRFNQVEISWTLGDSGVRTRIYRRLHPTEGSPTLIATSSVDATSFVETLSAALIPQVAALRYLVQHEAAADPSSVSGFTSEVSVETE